LQRQSITAQPCDVCLPCRRSDATSKLLPVAKTTSVSGERGAHATRCMMGWFIVTRAILVRTMFALHGVISIWLLSVVTGDAASWYMAASLTGLMFEAALTLFKKRGQEWKWLVRLEFHDADTDTDILARILADTSDTRDFLKLFLWQAERHADILATILARMSVSVSVSVLVSWNASLNERRDFLSIYFTAFSCFGLVKCTRVSILSSSLTVFQFYLVCHLARVYWGAECCNDRVSLHVGLSVCER